MAAQGNAAPILIKRKKIINGGGHHGGAWKVAYADFVTAMMAFFLLMWLLGATTEKQRKSIADYFSPVSVSREQSSQVTVRFRLDRDPSLNLLYGAGIHACPGAPLARLAHRYAAARPAVLYRDRPGAGRSGRTAASQRL